MIALPLTTSSIYRDVLGFEEKAAQPDTVHLVVMLDEVLTGMTLPAGTRFGGHPMSTMCRLFMKRRRMPC
ncbi:hypothetical protein P4S72_23470 [Vibrio sp. PP-XX7]